MAYPREIILDEDTEARLISYLNEELVNHDAERGEHVDDLMRWQKDYWAKPTQEEATFPFQGAATIVIPLNAIAVEAIFTRASTTQFAMNEIVSTHAISADWEDAARPLERFMNTELITHMKIRRAYGDCALEAIKFGTMIGKVGYEKTVKTALRMVGDTEEEFDVVTYDGAVFDAVSDSRFLMPHSARDPQTAPWCGEEHSENPYFVQQLEAGGMFREGTAIDKLGDENDPKNWSKLKAWINGGSYGETINQQGAKFEKQQAELEGTKAQWPARINWFEIWLAFDIDQSTRPKEIVVHYHKDSQTIMSCRYNWHSDLRRPYRTNVYMPVEHRWRGLGVCKQNEQFQKEVTVQHRQRIDNATLANMRMIVLSKLSGYGPKEPVFPGKMWFVDDVKQITTLQMGEVYPSSYQNEQATLIYSQQRTGVNEVVLGMPQVGTPGTATSDLARIQEGNKKFDFVYANFREFLGEIVVDTASCIQQFGPRNLPYFGSAENGAVVRDFFTMPEQDIRDGILIALKVSSQQQNKILDRQNWQQIAAMLTQYYDGILTLAQYAGNPQLIQIIVLKGMNAATEAMRQILDSFDTRNIDRIVVKEIEQMIRAQLSQQGGGTGGPNTNGNVPGGSGGPQVLNAPAGMDILSKILSAPRANGNGATNSVPVGGGSVRE